MDKMMKTGIKQAPNQVKSSSASIGNDKHPASPALVDNRSVSVLQRQLMECIDNSPVMTLQRQQLDHSFGASIQRVTEEDEELLQGKFGTIQQQSLEEEEEPLQGKVSNTESPTQLQSENTQAENKSGMPGQLKAGIESLSGMDMSTVRVHYNSSKPAQLNALAYAQGNDIHLGSGQEQHLPHEVWHIVQQKQGRVRPTMQMVGEQINDDAELEKEADVMGGRALQAKVGLSGGREEGADPLFTVIQRIAGLPKDKYVEVNDGGPLWYGQIHAVVEDGYQVRIGGTDTVKKVPFDQVGVHPSFPATTQQVAGEIFQSYKNVSRAAAIQSKVEEWAAITDTTHDPILTLKFMMVCKALSTNRRVAALLANGDDEIVHTIVQNLRGLFVDNRQIIQEWNNTAQDIAARAEAWDIFLSGVDALSGGKGNINRYFYNCLVHDKGYGQTHEATQLYPLLIGQQQDAEDDPFDSVLRAALAQHSNSNIWIGGQLGGGKIGDQLARGYDTEKLDTIPHKRQEDQMWGSLVTALITAHSPGNPDWSYAAVIRTNEDLVFSKINAIVPGKLNMSGLNGALELMGA